MFIYVNVLNFVFCAQGFKYIVLILFLGVWKICSEDIYEQGLRGPLNLGPARRVAENPFLIIIGRAER